VPGPGNDPGWEGELEMTSQPHSPEKVQEYKNRQRNRRRLTRLQRLLEKSTPDQPDKRIPFSWLDALAGKQPEEES